MLSFEHHRRAIAVVARLSVFAGLTGCAGSIVTDTDGETDPDAETGETTAGATTGETTDSTTAATTSGATTSTPTATCAADSVSVPCCNDALLAAFADPAFLEDPAQATDQHKDCCELLVSTMDTWTGEEELAFDSTIAFTCCHTGLVEGTWEEHPTCTPWGPPMPPRFRRARPRAGEARPGAARPPLPLAALPSLPAAPAAEVVS